MQQNDLNNKKKCGTYQYNLKLYKTCAELSQVDKPKEHFGSSEEMRQFFYDLAITIGDYLNIDYSDLVNRDSE